MINQKRLTQIEVSLTPEQHVVLWLQQEFQGKTSDEYTRWLFERPVSALPRIRVERQVARAIQAAMKGQDPGRIQEAARQAMMDADFRILLVFRTNSVVEAQSRFCWLRTCSIFTRLYVAGLRREDVSHDPADELRDTAVELFSLQLAVERIQARYFAGECILATDSGDSLEIPVMILRPFLEDLDQELEKSGHQDRVIDSAEFRKLVDDNAAKKVNYIRALAKSEMLRQFGLAEAARAVLRPYVLGNQMTSP